MKLSYFSPLIELFKSSQDEKIAQQMNKYMKHKFSFYGIQSPKRKELQRQSILQAGKLNPQDAEKEIKSIWDNCKREVNYSILDILKHKSYWQAEESIELAEWLITHQSWWDSVDIIASHFIGQYFKNYPDKMQGYSAKWVLSDNIWLIRTSIIFQLKYKNETDFDLLKENIRQHSHSNEFFIKKAIGWALREYSKTNPNAVINFIENNKLQALSIREASKYI